MEKRVFFIFLIVMILGMISLIGNNFSYMGNVILGIDTCGDGTQYSQCAETTRFYCDNGSLESNCNICGCGNGFSCVNNQCIQANSCLEGNGVCSNQCEDGSSEFYPLTSSCNIEENNNGNINISNSKSIKINSILKNTNPYRILEDIKVNFYIQDTDIRDGFTLLTLSPNDNSFNTITLNISDNIDRSKPYILKTTIEYNDKTLNQDYLLGISNGTFSLIIKNVTFSNNELVSLGDDLLINFEIINKKCCIAINKKVNKFFGYCTDENSCASSKPYSCQDSVYVENCAKCGCNEDYYCDVDGSCKNKISSQELNRFYQINNININEQSILGNFIANIPRIPRTPVEPIVKIVDKQIKINIENITILGNIQNNTPQLSINLGS